MKTIYSSLRLRLESKLYEIFLEHISSINNRFLNTILIISQYIHNSDIVNDKIRSKCAVK